MSDINLDFTVSNNSIQFTVEPNEITITPTDIQLTLGSTGGAAPSGNVGQLQYKVSSLQFGGIPTATYDGSNLALGNVANLKITGGTNGYFLQTDGTGNLNWAVAGSGGNGTPGGSNTQIQFNDSGAFGGNTGFTFNKVTGAVSMPGNLTVAGNIVGSFNSNYANFAGNVVNNSQPNITTVGTLTSLNVVGTVTASAITANTGLISGNGAGISNLAGSNVIGQVANALVASTVTTNAQPNITSVGTLTDLFVSNQKIHLGLNTNGNGGSNTIAIGVNAGNSSQSDEAIAIGVDAGKTNQSSDAIAIGTNSGATSQGSRAIAIGNSTASNTQGTYAIAIGNSAGTNTQGSYSIAIGDGAGYTGQGQNSVAIGTEAGYSNAGTLSISIGKQAGAVYNQSIVLNASGANFFATQANSLFIKPIRNVTGNAAFSVALYYNPTTGEIGYK
jgi:hypothetical protein